MKPIGTITMYFPLIGSETREILEITMNECYDYHDFVKMLVNKVCKSDCDEYIVFFATHHATNLFDIQSLDRIASIHGKREIIRPELFLISALQGRQEDFLEVRKAAERVLSSKCPNWLKMEMLATKLEAEVLAYPKYIFDDESLHSIEGLLSRYPELDFYWSRVFDALGLKAYRNGEIQESMRLTKLAITNAEKHDECNKLARLYRNLAVNIQSTDMQKSLDLLAQSCEMLEEMGDKEGLSNSIYQLSKIEAIRGEFDQSITHHLSAIKLRQEICKPIGPFALTLSSVYNSLGNYDAGMEWALMAEAEFQPIHKPRAILNQVWALAGSRESERSKSLMDSIREVILKSGMESHLAALYFVEGILEISNDSYLTALSSIEESMKIYQKRGALLSFYICLYTLSKLELRITQKSSSPEEMIQLDWINHLHYMSEENDLPGFKALALSLQAHMRISLGQLQRAKEATIDLISLVEKYNLGYLDSTIKTLQDYLYLI